MLLIGLLLIAVAALVTAAVLIEATQAQTLEVFGTSISTTTYGVFLIGMGTMLVLLLGLWLLQKALNRARRRRSEVKSLKRDRKDSVGRLEREKADLEDQLRRERDVRSEESGPTAAAAGQRDAAGDERLRQPQDTDSRHGATEAAETTGATEATAASAAPEDTRPTRPGDDQVRDRA